MSPSLRWSVVLATAALVFPCIKLHAQSCPQVFSGNPGSMLPFSGPLSVSVGVLGNPGYYSPGFMSGPTFGAGPALSAIASMRNPYCLMTSPPTVNPFMPFAPSLSPYALSTAAAFYPPYYPPEVGLGPVGSAGFGLGYMYQGMASLTGATGQYWKDIQTASLAREGVRQAALETARRRVELEAWYDSIRPTAPRMRAREMATELDSARTATNTEILSGRALNTLLQNIQKASKLNRGPMIGLEESTLKNVNLTTGPAGGNIGLLKDGGKVAWPDGLREPLFDEIRDRLNRNLELGVLAIKDGEEVPIARRQDIKNDYRTMTAKLEKSANELSPDQYVEARRHLRQLGQAIKALSEPKVANYFNNTWNAKGKTVAELVSHMTREGLLFAPATDSDEAAYRALYQALRAYEAGLQVAQK